MRTISLVVLLSACAFVACAQEGPPVAGHLRQRAISLRDHHWIRRATPHADLYVLASSRAESLLNTLPADVERAIAADLAFLGVPFTGPRLALFFVGTREEMRPLVGATPGGHAATDEGAAFFVGNDSIPPALRHELMHLLSWRLWGTPATAWMSEGLATLAAGHCGRRYSIADIAAALDREQQLIPLDTLWHHFTYSAEVGAMRYIEGASLMEYIDRTYGRQRLRAFWPVDAFDHVHERLGVDRATLERRWRKDVARHEAPATWATIFAAISQYGCE